MYFSVLVPVYNQMGKMDKCIDSLRNQTLEDFEVIFVDDGSTDGSSEFLDKLCDNNERFFVYHHDSNKSLTAARFTGMEHAMGSHIFFLDSDDFIERTALEDLKNAFDSTGSDVIRFGVMMEPMGVTVMPPETDDFLSSFMKGEIPPAIWKNAYDASVIKGTLEKCSSFYCNMGEDSFFSTVFFGNADVITSLNKVLYHYDALSGMSQTSQVSTMSKLNRDYESAHSSGQNILRFIKKYKPEYIELAQKSIRHMYRYILCQNILYAKDYLDVSSYLNFFREKGEKLVYEFGCKELIPYKVKFDLKRKDERFSDIELEELFTLLPEK